MTNLLPAAVGVDGRVNLFVGNLPYRVRWQDLKDLFRKAGTVLRADVSLNSDNRSRGYGTVLMGSREDAARAIDRFNGFTWQTRTLEVRPDRLPPEYEPHPHHAIPRPSMYPYQNMSGMGHPPFPLPGHLTPSNSSTWLPGQLPAPRPPLGFPHGPGSQPMFGTHPMPGFNPSTHPSHLGTSGSPPLISHSPTPPFGPNGLPLPLSGQNTGSHGFLPLGASPLAGSLSAGTFNEEPRRGSFAAFVQSISPNASSTSLPRSASPAPPLSLPLSRGSSNGGLPGYASSSDHPNPQPRPTRDPVPSNLGNLPPPFPG
ncbi:hypothetical protein TREMEDRAFT_56132, partial [Tremella mesenterica DSM 1558]|uniref:uncharacterized protein n=1 Tax=Tremella mesenterica (strain ATCC 24925 / CBS 8224 / DSM 1558 / NBRC 9311 / NRRL Y-6157 / RJB 2259-6 / UBC 559-6) TaxID=578456 RepID=UPI0003F498A9